MANFYKLSTVQEEYKKKLTTADEAVKVIKSGDRVHYGLFNGLVVDLDKALAKRTEELKDVIIMTTIWAWPFPPAILEADPKAEHFKYLSTQFSARDRKYNKQGCCWYVPVQFRENPKYWAESVERMDVAMLQVGPMDKWGNFNLGPQVAEYWGFLGGKNRAKKIIVEVNPKQPKAHGVGVSLNISEVDMVVEQQEPVPMPDLKAKDPTEIDKKIAAHVIERVKDGSTMQLGVGGLPNYIGSQLAEAGVQDLGVHSEMFVDAYLKMYEQGCVTGKKKNLNKGQMVHTFCQGSQALYDFLDDNPIVQDMPVDYVNDIGVIGSQDNFVSVNSILQVDIQGQVNSESAKWQHIGGNGGQVDFVLGAYKSNGGQSFLCTPSTLTHKDGTKESLIVPRLMEGATCTVPRTGPHFIVTENGAVNLKGRSMWERAELLISIAAPEFQDDLVREAERMGLWKTSSKVTY